MLADYQHWTISKNLARVLQFWNAKIKFEESTSAISHVFRLKSCKKTSSELENLSSASVASTSDYDRRKLYKPTSDWACFSLRYRNLACSTRYLFTTMFLIDDSKNEEDIEWCDEVVANAYFGRSEQTYRVGTACMNWRYNCKELPRKGWKGLYILLLCEKNTNRTISLMWTAAVLVYFFIQDMELNSQRMTQISPPLLCHRCSNIADMRICENDLRFFTNSRLF